MPTGHNPVAHRRVRGVSLVESMCVVSVIATALGLAAPDLSDWQAQQALLASAAELETDIQYARSQAVSMNRPVRVTTQALGGGSCYVLHTGEAGDCVCKGAGQSSCINGAQPLRLVEQPAGGPVALANGKMSMEFAPQHGTVTPTATFKLVNVKGQAVHQVVNIMGRTRSCTPGGPLPGIKPC